MTETPVIEITHDEQYIIIDISQVWVNCKDTTLTMHGSVDRVHWWDVNEPTDLDNLTYHGTDESERFVGIRYLRIKRSL